MIAGRFLVLAAGLALLAAAPARGQEEAPPAAGAPVAAPPASADDRPAGAPPTSDPEAEIPRSPAPLGPVGGPLLPTPSGAAGPSPQTAEGEPSIDRAYGAFQRGYYLSALAIAEPLANLGDPAAQTLLGEIHLRGLGVPRDEVEAARWYRVAAESGVPEAQLRYAMMLIEGTAVERDEPAARELMRKAADGGNPLAAFNYGQMLIQTSPTGGFAEAYRYFELSAKSGVAEGQYALAQLHANGRGVPEANDAEARKWLRAAAVQGHDTAQIELGIWLINGRGGAADPERGFLWLKGAAEGGNPIAFNRVAHLYKDGVGVARDTAAAAKWTVLARRARNTDVELDRFFRSLSPAEQQRALEEANRFRAG